MSRYPDPQITGDGALVLLDVTFSTRVIATNKSGTAEGLQIEIIPQHDLSTLWPDSYVQLLHVLEHFPGEIQHLLEKMIHEEFRGLAGSQIRHEIIKKHSAAYEARLRKRLTDQAKSDREKDLESTFRKIALTSLTGRAIFNLLDLGKKLTQEAIVEEMVKSFEYKFTGRQCALGAFREELKRHNLVGEEWKRLIDHYKKLHESRSTPYVLTADMANRLAQRAIEKEKGKIFP